MEKVLNFVCNNRYYTLVKGIDCPKYHMLVAIANAVDLYQIEGTNIIFSADTVSEVNFFDKGVEITLKH
jgi:hypothetical protein